MSQKSIIEVCGTISKVEDLGNVQVQALPNTLVLESLQPFYGYYGEYPVDDKPRFMFLVTDEHYTTDTVSRAVENIHQYYSGSFDAVTGYVEIYNDKMPVIRIRDLEEAGSLEEIQSGFINEGIKFRKKRISVERQAAIIQLKKVFLLEEVEKDLYLDLDEEEMGYFRIPGRISWKVFEKHTISIKYNWNENNFDGALGTLFRHSGLQDMIRIYKKGIDTDYLRELRDRYMSRLAL